MKNSGFPESALEFVLFSSKSLGKQLRCDRRNGRLSTKNSLLNNPESLSSREEPASTLVRLRLKANDPSKCTGSEKVYGIPICTWGSPSQRQDYVRNSRIRLGSRLSAPRAERKDKAKDQVLHATKGATAANNGRAEALLWRKQYGSLLRPEER